MILVAPQLKQEQVNLQSPVLFCVEVCDQVSTSPQPKIGGLLVKIISAVSCTVIFEHLIPRVTPGKRRITQ